MRKDSVKSDQSGSEALGIRRPRLLMLGGLAYMIPAIEEAHRMGIYVVTADWLPENPAHRHSDEYINLDVTDKERVLAEAERLGVDGVMAFAVDPAVETAAYVCQRLRLPFAGGFEAVRILQNKHLFRRFLAENGFATPGVIELRRDDIENLSAIKLKLEAAGLRFPLIVKPTDSAGSKGVRMSADLAELQSAAMQALSTGRNGIAIAEEFIEADGAPSDSEMFSIGGRVEYISFSEQYFDKGAQNPFVPAGYVWPSRLSHERMGEARRELQRLLNLLNLQTGIFNVELRFGRRDGRLYIMECSPRAGGNRLAETLDEVYGSYLIANAVRAAVGMEPLPFFNSGPEPGRDATTALVILHASRRGLFNGLHISPELKGCVDKVSLNVKVGDEVGDFSGANHMAGTVRLRFEAGSNVAPQLFSNDLIRLEVGGRG